MLHRWIGEPLPEAPEHDDTEGSEDFLPRLEAATRDFDIELDYQKHSRTRGTV